MCRPQNQAAWFCPSGLPQPYGLNTSVFPCCVRTTLKVRCTAQAQNTMAMHAHIMMTSPLLAAALPTALSGNTRQWLNDSNRCHIHADSEPCWMQQILLSNIAATKPRQANMPTVMLCWQRSLQSK
jgi:hypothetical protein